MSKDEIRSARAISSIERLPSAFVTTFHSSGVRVTGPFAPSRATSTGTDSVPGIFFERIFHSSLRRAASSRRFVFERLIVWASLSTPGENWKEPWLHSASA